METSNIVQWRSTRIWDDAGDETSKTAMCNDGDDGKMNDSCYDGCKIADALEATTEPKEVMPAANNWGEENSVYR